MIDKIDKLWIIGIFFSRLGRLKVVGETLDVLFDSANQAGKPGDTVVQSSDV